MLLRTLSATLLTTLSAAPLAAGATSTQFVEWVSHARGEQAHTPDHALQALDAQFLDGLGATVAVEHQLAARSTAMDQYPAAVLREGAQRIDSAAVWFLRLLDRPLGDMSHLNAGKLPVASAVLNDLDVVCGADHRQESEYPHA